MKTDSDNPTAETTWNHPLKGNAMLREGLEKIDELISESKKPQLVRLAHSPANCVHVLYEDRVEPLWFNEPAELIGCHTLNSFIEAVEHHREAYDLVHDPVVFYYPDRVETTIQVKDSTWPDIKIVLEVLNSTEKEVLEVCLPDPMHSPQELVYKFRYALSEAMPNKELEKAVSTIQFRMSDDKNVELKRDRESIGRSVQSAIESPALPDPIQWLKVRPFKNADLNLRFDLKCRLDPATSRQGWYFAPFECAFHEMVNKATEELIGNPLRAELDELTVLHGSEHRRNHSIDEWVQ